MAQENGKRLRGALLVRISDDPDGLEKGVERQEADGRAFAAERNIDIVKVFKENDTSAFKKRTITLPSGEKVLRVIRPEFRKTLTFFQQGGADVLIAYDLDRATRDPRDLEDLIDAKVLHGFGVLSVTGSLRLDNDSDIAMARVLVAMANKSSADTARRVARASRQQAEEGTWHGGRAPFGYRMGDSTLTIIPEQALLLNEAAQRILAGETTFKITKDWNARGLRTQRGNLWMPRTLNISLRNPALKGIRTYFPVLPNGSRAPEPLVEREGNWTPVIAPDIWQKMNDVLDARAEKRRVEGQTGKRVHPFTGILRCSKCGTSMYRRARLFYCSNSLHGTCSRAVMVAEVTPMIEQAVLSVFEKIAIDPTIGPRQVAGDSRSPDREKLTAHLNADQDALDRLDDDHYDGLVDRATWARQRSRIQKRLQDKQQELRDALATVPTIAFDIEARSVASEWPHRTMVWRYEATRLVLEAVLIHAHPVGRPTKVNRLRNESDEAYEARFRAHREELLAERVEFVWRA